MSLRLCAMPCPRVIAFVAAGCVFCASSAAARERLQPKAWDADLTLTEAADLNPDPGILEVNLEARIARVDIADKQVDAWTYDGRLPGPLIRLRVGDRLIVHFSNSLPKPTTVHWHGIRLPNQMDGVPGHSQPDVQPGETFTYDFIVPDAGLFWYHPHVMSAAQVGFGLYGPLLVEDPADPVGGIDELVLVLSDIEIREDGTLESPDTGASTGMAFGREGNHVLVNGRTRTRLLARAGAPQRWRIVNAAKSRYFQLDVSDRDFGNPQALTLIGVDGGLLEHPVTQNTLVLAPGERADVLLRPTGAPGATLVLWSQLFDRGYGSTEARTPFQELIPITMADLPPYVDGPFPDTARAIAPLSTVGATPIDIEFTIGQLRDGTFEYRINGEPFAKDRAVRAMPGETQVWTVTNKTKWSHPFHLHGFFFQALDEHGSPVRPRAWKDTVDVPYERSTRFVVQFDDRPGNWMYHCHVLDHADGGLMGILQVGAAGKSSSHHHER